VLRSRLIHLCAGSRDRKLRLWELNWDDFAGTKEARDVNLSNTLRSTSPALGPIKDDREMPPSDAAELQLEALSAQRSAPRPARAAHPPTPELNASAKKYADSFEAERLRAENEGLKSEIESLKHALSDAREKREAMQQAFDRLEGIYHSSMDDARQAGMREGEKQALYVAREQFKLEWSEVQRQRVEAEKVMTLLLYLFSRSCTVNLKHKLVTKLAHTRHQDKFEAERILIDAREAAKEVHTNTSHVPMDSCKFHDCIMCS
jgi:hypothetical protein